MYLSRLKQYYVPLTVTIVLLFITSSPLFAFTSNRAIRGPLSFEVSPIAPVTVEGEIYKAPLRIENSSQSPITIDAEYSSIDTVLLYSENLGNLEKKAYPNSVKQTFVVEGNSVYKGSILFSVQGSYRDAHYPIRTIFRFNYNNQTEQVDLRPIFSTDLKEFLPVNKQLSAEVLSPHSYINLSQSNKSNFAPYWRDYDSKLHYLPIGWSGVEPNVKCSLNLGSTSRNGVSRSSWSIHPPYVDSPGIFGLRFIVSLPEASKIVLRFSRAMRDVFAPEPPTDGVIFRVYASSLGENSVCLSQELLAKTLETNPKSQTLLLDEQYNGTTWSEANVDLTQFANQFILLTFETDPGVKKDTTCDGSFWGDVVLIADPQDVKVATKEERDQLRQINKNHFLEFVSAPSSNVPSSGIQIAENSRGFNLDDNQFAVVTLGNNGICDGWITIGSRDRFIQIDGVKVQYQGVNIGYDQPLETCKISTSFVENQDLEKSARLFAYQHNSKIISELPIDTKFTEEDLKQVSPLGYYENALACFISKTSGGQLSDL